MTNPWAPPDNAPAKLTISIESEAEKAAMPYSWQYESFYQHGARSAGARYALAKAILWRTWWLGNTSELFCVVHCEAPIPISEEFPLYPRIELHE